MTLGTVRESPQPAPLLPSAWENMGTCFWIVRRDKESRKSELTMLRKKIPVCISNINVNVFIMHIAITQILGIVPSVKPPHDISTGTVSRKYMDARVAS